MIAWIDLETTGLTLDCAPIEVAMIVTDFNLNEVDVYESLIKLPVNPVLQTGALELHKKSGLWDKVMDPVNNWKPTRMVDMQMEEVILKSLSRNKGKLFFPGGSSVHFDTGFFDRYFPLTFRRLHYRHLDVSSLKILFSIATGIPTEELPPKKNDTKHRALDDIRDSLEAARTYREYIDVKLFKDNVY